MFSLYNLLKACNGWSWNRKCGVSVYYYLELKRSRQTEPQSLFVHSSVFLKAQLFSYTFSQCCLLLSKSLQCFTMLNVLLDNGKEIALILSSDIHDIDFPLMSELTQHNCESLWFVLSTAAAHYFSHWGMNRGIPPSLKYNLISKMLFQQFIFALLG